MEHTSGKVLGVPSNIRVQLGNGSVCIRPASRAFSCIRKCTRTMASLAFLAEHHWGYQFEEQLQEQQQCSHCFGTRAAELLMVQGHTFHRSLF